MTEVNTHIKIEQLKKNIISNVAVDDDAVCAFCRELISAARKASDWQSMVFGYVWLADHHFYVTSNMAEVSKALDIADRYIDREEPCELLEKFYTLRHVVDEFDMRSALYFCLKALEVAEKANITSRIWANYGNLGDYFLEYECYEESLFYSKKAAQMLHTGNKPRISRLILSNMVRAYVKSGNMEAARETIKELSELPIEGNDLKLYVDYGYLLYYSEMKDSDHSIHYLQEMFDDGLLKLGNRGFVIELLDNAAEAMMTIGNKSETEETLNLLEDFIEDGESGPRETLCKLKIKCARQFGAEKIDEYYKEYYELYQKNRKQTAGLKQAGLRAKMRLNDPDFMDSHSQNELQTLYELASYDDLTMIHNRRHFNVRQNEIINSKEITEMGFVLFDVDYFKEYNDHYGHVAGDEVLKQVAKCLQEYTGEHMNVFRYGGDEFVCLVWDDGCRELEEYVEKTAQMLKDKDIEHNRSQCAKRVTLSIGYGCRPVRTRMELLNLFDEVDEALYEAKNSGRNNAKSILHSDSERRKV